MNNSSHLTREHRRRRMRRHRRRAYIRSVYFLPSLATLGNAICGFAAMYIATFAGGRGPYTTDTIPNLLARHPLDVAAYLIFLAMVFDALDGRLARFARHTTDFGGQLDSLADVVSFGAAPAFLSLFVAHSVTENTGHIVTRLIWAVAALYFACAAIRLARFNVSNEHGEQHHFSFLGLPSPGAGGAVAAYILMHQEFAKRDFDVAADIAAWVLPVVVLGTGLLMVSNVRYPHLVNRYLRGRRSFARLLIVVAIFLMLVVAHEYTIAAGTLVYAFAAPAMWAYSRIRPKVAQSKTPESASVGA